MLAYIMLPISFSLVYLKFLTALYSDLLGEEPLLMFNISYLLRFFQLMLVLIGPFLGQAPLELDLLNTIIRLSVLPLEVSDLLLSLANLVLQPCYVIISFSCPHLGQVGSLISLLHIYVSFVLHSFDLLVHVKYICLHASVVITIVTFIGVSRNFFLIVVLEPPQGLFGLAVSLTHLLFIAIRVRDLIIAT